MDKILKVGQVCTVSNIKCKIINIFVDADDEKTYFEVTPIEFNSFTREVTADKITV